jgi:hypothetical protein
MLFFSCYLNLQEKIIMAVFGLFLSWLHNATVSYQDHISSNIIYAALRLDLFYSFNVVLY